MDWLNKPLRIADFSLVNLREIERGEFQIERSLDKKATLGFNAEHFFPHKRGGAIAHGSIEPAWEILPQYLEAAHRRGIRLFVYYNVHWYSLEMARAHPQWFQYDFQGKLIDKVYGNGVMSCVNTGWREYTYEYIRRFAQLGVDGIFLDGPCFHPQGCYCESCQVRFQERYGKDLPPKGEMSDPDHQLLVAFQEDSMADYMKGAYQACKAANPRVVIYLNGEPLRPSWASGRNNRKLAPYQDLVGAEGGFIYGKLIETPIFKPGMTAKGLEAQAPDKPRVIFIADKHSPWNRNPLPDAELKIECAQALANGANYWIGYTFPDTAADRTIQEINGWVAGNEAYFSGTQDASEVGLLWSYETANTYGGEIPQSDFTGETIRVKRDYVKSFQGAYEVLQRAHIPFRIVDRAADAGQVRLLVLPNCACLSREEVAYLENYVERGGKLLVSFETSLYSPQGKLQDDFGLGKLLGVRYRGIEAYGTFENYFQIEERFFPAYTYVLQVEPTTAVALGYLSENTRGAYQPIIMSSSPAVCRNDLGKGRVYYFCGNFFQTYYDYKFPAYLSLFQRFFDAELARQVVTDAPESVEVTVRKKGNFLLIHLINFSSGLKRPIESLIPVEDVTLRLPGVKATRVTGLLGQACPRWQARDDLVEITVPRLHAYEVVVVETMDS